MKKKDVEWDSTTASFEDSNLTLEKLAKTYKLLPPNFDVWEELAKKYDMDLSLGDLLVLSTKDQDELIDYGLEFPTWVKFSICVDEGEMIVVRASNTLRSSIL